MQNSMGDMERVVHWYLAILGIRGWGGSGHARLEWATEFLPHPIDSFNQVVVGQVGELLGPRG